MVFLIAVGFWVLLMFAMDEHWQPIVYKNETSSPVTIDLSVVPLNYNDTPTLSWNGSGVVIGVGEAKEYLTPVSDSKKSSTRQKYTVIAVTETNDVVFSKIFTWDELHDMGWTVVIK